MATLRRAFEPIFGRRSCSISRGRARLPAPSTAAPSRLRHHRGIARAGAASRWRALQPARGWRAIGRGQRLDLGAAPTCRASDPQHEPPFRGRADGGLAPVRGCAAPKRRVAQRRGVGCAGRSASCRRRGCFGSSAPQPGERAGRSKRRWGDFERGPRAASRASLRRRASFVRIAGRSSSRGLRGLDGARPAAAESVRGGCRSQLLGRGPWPQSDCPGCARRGVASSVQCCS